jgi:DNA (cytosine-5)-methyltransferase 1
MIPMNGAMEFMRYDAEVVKGLMDKGLDAEVVKGLMDKGLDEGEFHRLLHGLNEKTPEQKTNGIYNTPNDVVDFIVANCISPKFDCVYPGTVGFDDGAALEAFLKGSIFDPTVGSGEFLVQAFLVKVNFVKTLSGKQTDKMYLDILASLYGNDIDELAIEICKIRLFFETVKYIGKGSYKKAADILNRNLTRSDFINLDTKAYGRTFDFILGNPPYVEDNKSKIKPDTRYGNVYANVLRNSIDLLNPNGKIGFIVPISYVSTPRMNKIRRYVEENTTRQKVFNFADRPSCLFAGVHQKLTVLIAEKGQPGHTVYTSGYQYWYKNERAGLFKKPKLIENTYANDRCYPKLNGSMDVGIFGKVNTAEDKGISSYEKGGKANVFLNMRVCFWIKAFSFAFESKEYKGFCFDEDKKWHILALLNSSLFWWYWNAVSDCWHITQKELDGFFVPVAVFESGELAQLALSLETELERTKVTIRTKQTNFEYKHRLCRDVIDKIDDCIASYYGLTQEEAEYIKEYGKIYRDSLGVQTLRVIDLFAGCGGFSTGFRQAGFAVTHAVEFDKTIAGTYAINHPGTTLIVDDIKNADEDNVFEKNCADVIIGGPPCQGFSMAGARIRRNRFLDDERNYLFKHYLNIVKRVRPKVFVFENVKGLQTISKGEIFAEMIRLFGDAGYFIHYEVVKMKDFGIPQTRERIIIIGSLFPWCYNTVTDKVRQRITARHPGFFDPVVVWDVLSGLESLPTDGTADIPNHIATNHAKIAKTRMNRIKTGKNFTSLDEDIKSVHSGSYGRLEKDKPAPTITTRFDTPSGGKFIHPTLNRTITPREAARLQSFDDGFVFSGSKTSICKQIGNAVPPKVAYFLAEVVKELLSHG